MGSDKGCLGEVGDPGEFRRLKPHGESQVIVQPYGVVYLPGFNIHLYHWGGGNYRQCGQIQRHQRQVTGGLGQWRYELFLTGHEVRQNPGELFWLGCVNLWGRGGGSKLGVTYNELGEGEFEGEEIS